ncbi:phospholipase [Pseudomonas fluorescens]|uniref:phospholipase n=1 Tax=Pseudomonas fluorescens TaxID=294 RepID=UPI00054C6146|nr:phospholipase [Pseudomonas fluorescens]KII33983.1 phospholipase [Pseudomonas fluorescens]
MDAQYNNHQWMGATPAIDNLSLFDMTLPGTHNAGSDWKALYPIFGPPRHWLACQHGTFYDQLHNGSRALDIRLVYDPKAVGPSRFAMHHNGFRNSRTLDNLLTDINAFLDKQPDEFIIIDFHELAGDNFDFKLFNDMIMQSLGKRLIPRNNRLLNLQQLKHISPVQRVMVATRSHQALHSGIFVDSVSHEWSGKAITSVSELQQFIANAMQFTFGVLAPWSLSATSYTALGGPVDIHGELDVWFDPAKSDWAQKCNIINVDFIEESRIVEFCRAANLIKARRRRA